MSELLDAWEKDANSINQTYSVEGPDGKLRSYDDAQAWRIRRLVELVRKKDEAFKTIKRFRPDRKALAENPFESDVELISALASALEVCSDECDGALSLTDQLGGSGE